MKDKSLVFWLGLSWIFAFFLPWAFPWLSLEAGCFASFCFGLVCWKQYEKEKRERIEREKRWGRE